VVALSCTIAFLICLRLETLTGDYFVANLSQRDVPQDIVIVTINEGTLATLAYRSPIDRKFLADIIKKIDNANPRAIGIDLLIDQPSEPQKDSVFIQILETTKAPITIGYATGSDGLNKKQLAYQDSVLQNLQKGLVTLSRDDFDGTVRQLFIGRTVQSNWYSGLAAALAEQAGHKAKAQKGRITYYRNSEGGPFKFTNYPAHTVKFIPAKWFEGKIVLIGATLPATDQHTTPFTSVLGAKAGALFGITIHAHMLAQIIAGDQLWAPGALLTIMIVLVLALIASALVITPYTPLLRLMLVILLIVTFSLGAFVLFRVWHILIPVATPVVAATISSIFLALGQWYQDREQRQFIENAFSKYVSPAIVQKIVANRQALVLGGETRMVTFVFTDLKDFTTLCEGMKPEAVALLLNDYLDQMCTLFVEADATIDKIIGDAVVGFFGAPEKQEDQAKRAINLALAIDQFSQDYCKIQQLKGINLGITRIGIHKGNAVIGNFGGSRFMDYTGIGDTVNTAARLEAANKHFGTRICVSQEVKDGSPSSVFRPIGRILLKGKSEAIECFEPMQTDPESKAMVTAYIQAFTSLSQEEDSARAAFAHLSAKYPNDPLIALHHQRLQQGDKGATIELTEK